MTRLRRAANLIVLPIVVCSTTFLCSLVAGFLLAFGVVVMPGIGQLDDRGFLRAFQRIDGVIQGNQPIFLVVWVGSAAGALTTLALAAFTLDGGLRLGLVAVTSAYLLGVQLPTIVINIPLNNRVQALDLDAIDDEAIRSAREAFEPRWNAWNHTRTVVACGVSAVLITLLAYGFDEMTIPS